MRTEAPAVLAPQKDLRVVCAARSRTARRRAGRCGPASDAHAVGAQRQFVADGGAGFPRDLRRGLCRYGTGLRGTSILDPTSQQLIDWGANSASLTLGGQWWRLVTSMFLHIGAMHIFFNMWCLWDLGGICESLYGHLTFAAVYLISGVGGSLASVWWRPMGVSAGASGAVFGVAGALIASYYLGEFYVPRFALRAHLRSLLVFLGYNLLFGAVRGAPTMRPTSAG